MAAVDRRCACISTGKTGSGIEVARRTNRIGIRRTAQYPNLEPRCENLILQQPAEFRGLLCCDGASDVHASRRSRSEPLRRRVRKSALALVSHPRHMPVGPYQYGFGRSDLPDGRKLPCTVIVRFDEID